MFSVHEARLLPVVPGRRMADTAADRRGASRRPGATVGTQFSLRDPLPLASDVERVSAVLAVFLRVVQGCIDAGRRPQAIPGRACGSVTFVQRFGSFGSSINLNPHCHVLVLDGVYVIGDGGTPLRTGVAADR